MFLSWIMLERTNCKHTWNNQAFYVLSTQVFLPIVDNAIYQLALDSVSISDFNPSSMGLSDNWRLDIPVSLSKYNTYFL